MAQSRLTALEALLGQPLGVSAWLRIDQERIDAFAEATLDRQWIHVDKARALAGPFGATVVHGYLSLSLLSHFANDLRVGELRLSEATTVLNYGLGRVRFLQPVRAGTRIRDHIRLLALQRRENGLLVTLEHSLELEGETKPALVAETLLLILA